MTISNSIGSGVGIPPAFQIWDGDKYINFNPRKHSFYFFSNNDVVSANSGTGSSVTTFTPVNYHEGRQLNTGTTNAGYASVGFDRISYMTAGKSIFNSVVLTDNDISTAIDEYHYVVGVGNSLSNPTEGYFFRYDRTVSVNWLACTNSSGTETQTDTGVPVDQNVYVGLTIVYDSTTPSVSFYIDDVLVATNTTNISTSASNFIRNNIYKSAGTTNRNLSWLSTNVFIIRD